MDIGDFLTYAILCYAVQTPGVTTPNAKVAGWTPARATRKLCVRRPGQPVHRQLRQPRRPPGESNGRHVSLAADHGWNNQRGQDRGASPEQRLALPVRDGCSSFGRGAGGWFDGTAQAAVALNGSGVATLLASVSNGLGRVLRAGSGYREQEGSAVPFHARPSSRSSTTDPTGRHKADRSKGAHVDAARCVLPQPSPDRYKQVSRVCCSEGRPRSPAAGV